ncbi:MAG TPA: class I SAM-dependent methyltransferase [Chryseosolibacter sp.]
MTQKRSITPDRFIRAAAFVDPQPNDVILEVGCGNGLLISLLTEKITTGRIVGCDKSPSAIRMATNRNAAAIRDGKVVLCVNEVKDLTDAEHSFDIIAAFNVNIFLKSGTRELPILHQLLSRNGKLVVFYQFPYEVTLEAAAPIIKTLKESYFKIVTKKLLKTKPRTIAIQATRLDP